MIYFDSLARRCLFQVAYAIGVAEPLSIYIDTYGTATEGRSDADVLEIVKKNFDLRPGAIIKELNLLRPIYRETAIGGHFGRTGESFPWEDVKELTKVSLTLFFCLLLLLAPLFDLIVLCFFLLLLLLLLLFFY